MNQQREFINETFHVLAQPITALRATVELGLLKTPSEQTAQRVLEDCLRLIDRLMQELAVMREMVSLDEELPLETCDGRAPLQCSVEEMALVAQDRAIAIHVTAEPAAMQCNEAMFRRAMFVLLDDMIASTAQGGEISISLRKGDDGFVLEARPGTPHGRRQELCQKLMQCAGGRTVCSASGTSVTFREEPHPSIVTTELSDKQPLSFH